MTHWDEPLSNFLVEYRALNVNGQYKPVAVGKYGIRSRESIYSKELAKDYSKNKLISQNTLTIGMGSNQIDIGILTDDVIYSVSPAYHTYKISGINAEYLDYCLKYRNSDMFARYVKRGSRQGKSIDLKEWLKYRIPIYDKDNQEHICTILDKVVELRELCNRLISKMDSLVKSQFIEMFAHKYEMVDIESLSTIIMGQSPSGDTYNTNQDGLPFYQGKTDFGNLYINLSKVYTSKPTKIAEEGDVLLSVRAPVGSTNISICQCCIGRGLAAIRPKENLSNQLYLLYSLREQENEIKNCGVGSTFDCISKNQIMRIKIYNAPFYEQSKFASFVEQIDKSKIMIQSECFA